MSAALSPAALAICRTHWMPLRTRCAGCPIEPECSTRPNGIANIGRDSSRADQIDAHIRMVNAAAAAARVGVSS